MNAVSQFALNILVGLLVAGILFLVRERFFAPASITGRWFAVLTTERSAFKPFLGMKRAFVVLLVSDGKVVTGSAEIVNEDSASRSRPLIGEDRVRATIDGRVTHNIFSRDIVSLHLTELGKQRTSTAVLEFRVPRRFRATTGLFWATAGDQEGIATLQREPLKSWLPRTLVQPEPDDRE